MKPKKEAPENQTYDNDLSFRHGSIMQVMVSTTVFPTFIDILFEDVELHVRRQFEL